MIKQIQPHEKHLKSLEEAIFLVDSLIRIGVHFEIAVNGISHITYGGSPAIGLRKYIISGIK